MAYLNHDLDDASGTDRCFLRHTRKCSLRNQERTHAERINSLIMDIIENSVDSRPTFSPSMLRSIETLRGFLYSSVYRHANAQIEDSR